MPPSILSPAGGSARAEARAAPPVARGRFISLEGGEGTGKSTVAADLRARLQAAGHEVVETREPGGTPGAEIVRHLLKSGAVEPLGAFAEAVMIAAARDDHVTHVIRPALAGGRWVVCDRFADSTRAYQGAGCGVDDKLLSVLERIAVGETRPDLTIILDAPTELALKRAKQRAGEEDGEEEDRFEKESLAFHEKLRRAFLRIADEDPERCVVVDASGPPDKVAAAVWRAVVERLAP